MRNFRILPLILLVALLLSCFAPAAWALEDPEVASNAVLIMETDSRSILYSKNENARVYPASTTKIMTVLLALEAVESGRISLTDQVTAGESMNYDLIPDGSSAGIQVGETMTLQDLLYCAMLASGNDACNVIAAYVGGDLATFIEMMNRRLRSWAVWAPALPTPTPAQRQPLHHGLGLRPDRPGGHRAQRVYDHLRHRQLHRAAHESL